MNIGEYRPISLLNSTYKIVTKVLALRLKRVMGYIFLKYQNALIKGRKILECNLIADEIIDSKMGKGVNAMVVKVDMMKTCDHMSCNFPEWVPQKMGVGEKWRKWGRVCIANAHVSIMINGSPKGHIKSSRVVRQGDLLSPFLFTLVTEIINRMTCKLVVGVLDGFNVSPMEESLCVLIYYLWMIPCSFWGPPWRRLVL